MDANTRVLRLVRVATWSVWAAVTAFVLSGFADDSTISARRAARLVQGAIIPEGWSFFTRDPREPKDVVYRRARGGLSQVTFANTSARNAYGVSRAARAMDAELMGLLEPVLESTWRDCDGAPEACVAAARPLALTNWSETRFICGDVAVVRAPPVPWAWRRSRDRIHMPSRVLALKVDCSRRRPARYRDPEPAARLALPGGTR
jgi:antimicrobial peptide system SdpA family protein